MISIESLMVKLAKFQYKHYTSLAILAVIITLFLAAGLPNIRMETDFSKELPQDLPVITLENKVSDTFGAQDIIMIVVRLDYESSQKNAVKDIRDPRVMQLLLNLEDSIIEESEIERVWSIGSVFSERGVPDNLEETKKVLAKIPSTDNAFNRDYSAVLFFAYANIGESEDKVKKLTDKIQEDMDENNAPPGVSMQITGMPSVRSTIMDLLKSDSTFTMIVSALIILVLLVTINKPWKRGVLIFIPLTLGVIWTLGVMGWINLPLNVATVGLGAMILGLGVEYGVFYVSRYKEERVKKVSQPESLEKTAKSVSTAIAGSSTTTIVGFLALTLASMPMIQKLGFALALGIFCCASATILFTPSVVLLEEIWIHQRRITIRDNLDRAIKKMEMRGLK